MDRQIEREKTPSWKIVAIAAVALVLAYIVYTLFADSSIRTYRVPAEQLIISTVNLGAFEDVIPIRGTIQPLNSVFLDAVNGGVVEEVFVEEGSFVEAGQPLLQLSNNNLRLSAAQNDTNITEQLNFLGNISNNLETDKLRTEREVIDIQYRLTVLERQKNRFEGLADRSLISEEETTSVLDEIVYQRKLLDNSKARQALEDKIRGERMLQIASQVEKLEENLEVSKSSFESLLVRAPISGQLTSLPVDIGESKMSGERLGQVDVVGQYKVVAQIDEFYVSRVMANQSSRFALLDKNYQSRIIKVYPEITNGTFEVDMVFESSAPTNIRRGQTLQMELVLGDAVESLLLPIGGFIQDTGGNWVFVLDIAGDNALRRDIRIGRRNNRYLEVLEGLRQGEKVITSGYGQMEDMDRVQLL
ncbi:MAG: HlyD family secretion protein [Pseudohongiellaceae bacterium]|jgi:HlyD family secretion protein